MSGNNFMDQLRASFNSPEPKPPTRLARRLYRQIYKRALARSRELLLYAQAPNSDDHLMLVAVPIARAEIWDVILADAVFDAVVPWLNECKSLGYCRLDRVERMAAQLSRQMIRKARSWLDE